VTVSFVLAFVGGVMAAYLPDRSGYLRHLTNFMRNVPPISLISLLILWFGIGETSKLIVIVLASVFPMYLNISKGFQECDVKLIEVGRSMGFGPVKIFRRICLPYAREDILVGLRTGLGYCWRALIGAEMFAAASGLGYTIVYAQQMSRSDKVIVGILLIGIIGCVSDWLFSLLIRAVCKGGIKND
jgi:sulfonate transport system permease protein